MPAEATIVSIGGLWVQFRILRIKGPIVHLVTRKTVVRISCLRICPSVHVVQNATHTLASEELVHTVLPFGFVPSVHTVQNATQRTYLPRVGRNWYVTFHV